MNPAISFTIPGAVPPSGNELRRKYRHWAAYARLREQWVDWVFAAFLGTDVYLSEMPGQTKERARVSIHVCRSRELDEDNLTAGLKPLYDALKKCGFIVNDSPKWMERDAPRQESSKDATLWATRITIAVAGPRRKAAR